LNRLRSYREFIEQAEGSPEYWIEGAILEFTEELSRAMASEKISRAELARRIGASPAYITKVLRGNANFTLASMVKLSRALGHELRLSLATAGSEVRYRDTAPTKVESPTASVSEPASAYGATDGEAKGPGHEPRRRRRSAGAANGRRE